MSVTCCKRNFFMGHCYFPANLRKISSPRAILLFFQPQAGAGEVCRADVSEFEVFYIGGFSYPTGRYITDGRRACGDR